MEVGKESSSASPLGNDLKCLAPLCCPLSQCSFCPKGKFTLDKLPEELPVYGGGEVFPIPEGDPRVGMVGKPGS